MKKVVLISALLFSGSAMAGDFCSGYKQGYKTGYKQMSGSSVAPVPPVCPVPPVKSLSDPQSDYEYGYVTGLKDGMRGY